MDFFIQLFRQVLIKYIIFFHLFYYYSDYQLNIQQT